MVDEDGSVWRCDDKKVVRAVKASMKKHRDTLNQAVMDAQAAWERLPYVFHQREYSEVAGISPKPEGEDQYLSHRERRELVIPDGWRLNQGSEHLTPIRRGGGPAAKAAREYIEKYSRIPNARQLLSDEYGAPYLHFEGLHMLSPGIEVKKGVLYVKCGSTYEIKDDRFERMKLSEYLAMKGK